MAEFNAEVGNSPEAANSRLEFLRGKKHLSRLYRRSLRAIFGFLFSLLILPYLYFIVLSDLETGATDDQEAEAAGDVEYEYVSDVDEEAVVENKRLNYSLYVTAGVVAIFTVGSFFSHRLTCVSALSLIDILTGRGRWIILIFTLNLLASNQAILTNIDEATNNAECIIAKVQLVMDTALETTKDFFGELHLENSGLERRNLGTANNIIGLIDKLPPNETVMFEEVKKNMTLVMQYSSGSISDRIVALMQLAVEKLEHTSSKDELDDEVIGLTPGEQISLHLDNAGGCNAMKFHNALPVVVLEIVAANMEEYMGKLLLDIIMGLYYTYIVLSKLIYANVLLSVFLATRYLKKFLVFDSHDNKRLDYNLSRAWTDVKQEDTILTETPVANFAKLLPLRRWESTFSNRWKAKPTIAEIVDVLLSFIPVIIVGMIVGGVLIVDILIYEAMDLVGGMARNDLYAKLNLHLLDSINFDLSECAGALNDTIIGSLHNNEMYRVAACAPNPTQPNIGGYLGIFGLLLICLVSAVTQPFVLRLRALIASFFYPARGLARATFLCESIARGRKEWAEDLKDTIEVAWLKKKRESEVGVIAQLKGKCKPHVFDTQCITCEINFNETNLADATNIRTSHGGKVKICAECYNDEIFNSVVEIEVQI